MLKEKTAQIKKIIDERGQEHHDKRFERYVKGVNGLLIDYSDCLSEKQDQLPDDKYREDWVRMYKSFRHACDETIKDQYSRQMLVLNTNNYLTTKQCFQLIQFIMNEKGDCDVYVYQRSADLLQKVEDDIKFFLYVINKFERKTFARISSFKVFYGNVHYTTKK